MLGMFVIQAAAVGLLSRKPTPVVTIRAHLTTRAGLDAGLAASKRQAQDEHVRLEDVIASLHAELQAAELEHNRIKVKAAPAMPTASPFGPMPASALVEPLAAAIAERKLRGALQTLLDGHVNETSTLVARVATEAGAHVGKAAADATASHAAEVAAKQLVHFACDFAAGPSADAAFAGAYAASNTSWNTHAEQEEAGVLARGAAKDDVLAACMDEAMPLMEAAEGNATAKASEEATASATLAATLAATKEAIPAATEAAQFEMVRVINEEKPLLKNFSYAASLRAILNDNATDASFASGTAQVGARTEELFDVAEAAAKLVAGAEKVAAQAALAAAAPEIPARVAWAMVKHRTKIAAAIANESSSLLLSDALSEGSPNLVNASVA